VSLPNFIIEIPIVLLSTLHITKTITEVLIFYADKVMVMGSSQILHVFNFAILLKLQNRENLMPAKYTRLTVFSSMTVLM